MSLTSGQGFDALMLQLDIQSRSIRMTRSERVRARELMDDIKVVR
jgi:hypothetical protein